MSSMNQQVVDALRDSLGASNIKSAPIPDDEYTFRIGTLTFLIPPTAIQVERIANTEYIPVLRSRGSIKKNAGKTDTRITLELIFHNERSINDPRRGLRGLLAMFRRAPFVPVYNRYLNNTENVFAVCLHDLQISSIPGFPRSLRATLTLLEFDWSSYLIDYPDFGSAIDWDLFEWYVHRGLTDQDGELPEVRLGKETEIRFHFLPENELEHAADQARLLLLGDLTKQRQSARKEVAHGRQVVDLIDEAQRIVKRLIELETRGYSAYRYDPNKAKEIDWINRNGTWVPLWNWKNTKKTGLHKVEVPKIIAGRSPSLGNHWVASIEVQHESIYLLNSIDLFAPYYTAVGEMRREFWNQTDFGLTSGFGGIRQLIGIIFDENGNLVPEMHRYLAVVDQAISYSGAQADDADAKVASARAVVESLASKMEPWEISGMMHLLSVQSGIQNHFARMPVQSKTLPAYQYLGSHDHRFQLALQVDEEALASLVKLFEYCQESARRYHSRLSSGFLRIDTPLAKLMGIKHVLIEAMVSQTMPGFPGHFQVELTLVDYDYFQASRTKGVFITKSENQFVIKDTDKKTVPGIVVESKEVGGESFLLEDLLPSLDAYPDLDLPTWDDLARHLSKLKGVDIDPESINTNGAQFVDPDFYFLAPLVSESDMLESFEEESLVLASRTGFQQELETRIIKPAKERLSKEFDAEPGEERLYPGEELDLIAFLDEGDDEQETFLMDSDPELGDIADPPEDDTDDPEPGIPHKEVLGSAFHNYLLYSKRGRMIRAFPTFYMFLIDEGQWVRTRRLWDNFYGFNAVSSIDVHHSREMATGTCVIELANASEFIQGNREGVIRHKDRTWRFDWTSIMPLQITDKITRERSDFPDFITLRPGAKLHLRAGYGNNIRNLPTIFNGTVVEVEYGEVVELLAQSDARELVRTLRFEPHETSSGLFGGYYPREYLQRLLLFGERGFFEREWNHLISSVYKDPIEVRSFGQPDFALGYARRGGELTQNIYRGSRTGKSRGIPVWDWIFKGEVRVPIELFGKSIYDIGEILAASVPNFIFATRPFGFRSTIFYGKPFWEYAYDYELRDIPEDLLALWEREKKPVEEIAEPRQFLSSIEINQRIDEISQQDEVTTEEAIELAELLELRNQGNLRSASRARGVALSESSGRMQELEKEGWRFPAGKESTFMLREKRKAFSQWHVYSSHSDILQNSISLSTLNLVTDVIGTYKEDRGWVFKKEGYPEVVASLDPDIYHQFRRSSVTYTEIKVPSGWMPLWKKGKSFTYGSFARSVALHIAGATLRDKLKTMYDGELIVIGDPAVWPHDTMYIGDTFRELIGTCFVREVYHSFSLETGFVTAITPDVASAIKDEEVFDWFGTPGALASTIGVMTSFRTSLFKIMQAAGVGSAFFEKAAFAKADIMAKVLASVSTRIGSFISFFTGPWILLLAPVLLLGWAMFNEGLYRKRFAQRMIVANFLTHKGREFSAGVDGYSQLTVGLREEVMKETFWDRIKDYAPGMRRPDIPIAAEMLYGEKMGPVAADKIAVAKLEAPHDLSRRIMEMSDRNQAMYSAYINSNSPIVRSAMRYIDVPYMRGGRDIEGMSPQGFLYTVVRDLGVSVSYSDSLKGYLDQMVFIHIPWHGFHNQWAGDILFLDRNGDGEIDQIAIVINDYGDAIVVLENELGEIRPGEHVGSGVQVIPWEELYGADSLVDVRRVAFVAEIEEDNH